MANPPRRLVIERFEEKVNYGASEECWPWLASTNNHGYGRLHVGNRNVYAHRLAWEFAYGPIPDGLCVLHRCDNPPCCNPRHLFLGTKADNTRDAMNKGRLRPNPSRVALSGEDHPNAKLTNVDVQAIRSAHAGGESQGSLSRRFNVGQGTISDVVHRRSWVAV